VLTPVLSPVLSFLWSDPLAAMMVVLVL